MSRLDHCNSLYAGSEQKSLNYLQLLENAAAHWFNEMHKHEHNTPVLSSLHSLPIHVWMDF